VPPADEAAVNATLTTEPGRALLRALVDYGAYVVDDTFWDAQQFCVESGVQDEFQAAWGLAMTGQVPEGEGRRAEEQARAAVRGRGAAVPPAEAVASDPSTAFLLDVTRLSVAMHVVSNSAASRVGGGGSPRVDPPPPIGN